MEKQIHSKFKLFIGKFDKNGDSASTKKHAGLSKELVNKIKTFSKSNPDIAPKSIGVEFLDESQEVIITLGYAKEKNANYNISLETSFIGPFSKKVLATLESKMEKVAKGHKNVICHELLITHSKQMYVVFLTATKKK